MRRAHRQGSDGSGGDHESSLVGMDLNVSIVRPDCCTHWLAFACRQLEYDTQNMGMQESLYPVAWSRHRVLLVAQLRCILHCHHSPCVIEHAHIPDSFIPTLVPAHACFFPAHYGLPICKKTFSGPEWQARKLKLDEGVGTQPHTVHCSSPFVHIALFLPVDPRDDGYLLTLPHLCRRKCPGLCSQGGLLRMSGSSKCALTMEIHHCRLDLADSSRLMSRLRVTAARSVLEKRPPFHSARSSCVPLLATLENFFDKRANAAAANDSCVKSPANGPQKLNIFSTITIPIRLTYTVNIRSY